MRLVQDQMKVKFDWCVQVEMCNFKKKLHFNESDEVSNLLQRCIGYLKKKNQNRWIKKSSNIETARFIRSSNELLLMCSTYSSFLLDTFVFVIFSLEIVVNYQFPKNGLSKIANDFRLRICLYPHPHFPSIFF